MRAGRLLAPGGVARAGPLESDADCVAFADGAPYVIANALGYAIAQPVANPR
jgi:hypothetical protein